MYIKNSILFATKKPVPFGTGFSNIGNAILFKTAIYFYENNIKRYCFTGIFFKISNKNFQNFCEDEIEALSSGLCAP